MTYPLLLFSHVFSVNSLSGTYDQGLIGFV